MKFTRPDSLTLNQTTRTKKERYVLVNAKNVGFFTFNCGYITLCIENYTSIETIQVKPQEKRKIKRNLNAKTTQ